jgi:F-type H+-transporting ATPase subunit b
MSRRIQTVILLFVLPLFLCFSSSEEKAQVSGWVDFLAKTINFVILFGGLAFLLAKPLRKFLGELALSIRKTMAETENARSEAEEQFELTKRRLQGLGEEVEAIRQGGEKAGTAEKERIQSLTRAEAEKSKDFSRQEIEVHAQRIRRELREYVADLAVSQAKAKIEKRLTPDIHSRLVDESIEGLAKLYEKSDSG